MLALWIFASWDAFAYVGESLESVMARADLSIPEHGIIQAVEEREEKELPGTLFLMGTQNNCLVFCVFYEGWCVREFYQGLSFEEASQILVRSGILSGYEIRPGKWIFSGDKNCADYYPGEGSLSVFRAAHGLKIQAYNQELRKAPQAKTP